MKKRWSAILQAVLAAALYALSVPLSKPLLDTVAPTMMAAFLYLGAGAGIAILSRFRAGNNKQAPLGRRDWPWAAALVLLDISAAILLMSGLALTASANASLLSNFEIVATAIIAGLIFKEPISGRLRLAIGLITLASLILSFEDLSSLRFSLGSALVLAATAFWGLENNITRKLSGRDTYAVVFFKGIGTGGGSLLIALAVGEALPPLREILMIMALGFAAYGLSIFFYIRAQRDLGAARTSAYYAIAPFIGAFFSFLFLREPLTIQYFSALAVMALGAAAAISDTLRQ